MFIFEECFVSGKIGRPTWGPEMAPRVNFLGKWISGKIVFGALGWAARVANLENVSFPGKYLAPRKLISGKFREIPGKSPEMATRNRSILEKKVTKKIPALGHFRVAFSGGIFGWLFKGFLAGFQTAFVPYGALTKRCRPQN